MNIREAAEKNRDYIIEKRRFYHMHPELSKEEVETTKYIMKDLADMGIKAEHLANGYNGCWAELKGNRPGKTILLRADIDALAVDEKTGLPFASKNPGKMHACGHDTHISMLLGAAKILSELKGDFPGNIRFIFQPAEELGIGAKAVIEQGITKGVDACYGVHIWSTIDAPKINMEYGPRMAAGDMFTIDITGYGAHGSAPHLGKDAVVAASAVIMGLQTIVSRVNDPLKPLVISVGKVTAGQRWNIIGDHATLIGTVRTFDKKFRNEQIEKLIANMVENTCKAYGCTGTLKYDYVVPPVTNEDKKLVDIARNAVIQLYGEDGLVHMEKITGAEDFSFYTDQIPCVFGFVGARSKDVPGSQMSNHHECFTADERSLERGAAVAAQFALDFLNNY